MVVVVGTFVLANRDSSSVAAAASGTVPLKAFLRGFWVNPRRHPDFAWAFGSRFLMVIGFYGAQTYGLYILRDYVGLCDTESNAFAATDRHRAAARRAALRPGQRLALRQGRSPQAVHRLVLGRHVDRAGRSRCSRRPPPACWSTASCSAWASAPTSPSTSP